MINEIVTACGLQAIGPDAECLRRYVGRRCRFAGSLPGDGSIHRDGIFEVAGVQKDYAGRLAFRVRCVQLKGAPFVDTFGMPMPVERFCFAGGAASR